MKPASPPSREEKIRVLEILGNAIVGGMENYVRNLMKNLSPEEFEVSVLCPYESAYTRLLRSEGWPVYIAPLRDDPPWRSIEMINSVVQAGRIQILHAHLMNAHTVAGIAGKLAGVPVVTTIHGMTLHPQEISLTRLTDSHLILVCREAWSQALGVGLSADKISLVPNGVDLTTFRPDPDRRALMRRHLQVADSEILIGFVGRLAWEKGPDKFLRAAEYILSHHPSVRFVIAGAGPMEKQIEAAIGRADIKDNVQMLGLNEEPWRLYPALDLMLHTSRSDAMPLAILEAMASGVPVVAIGVGGIPELIESGGTGVLIGTSEWPGIVSEFPGDWEGVAKAAVNLIDGRDHLDRMSRASHERAGKYFNIVSSARKTADVFRMVAGRRPGATSGAEVVSISGQLSA